MLGLEVKGILECLARIGLSRFPFLFSPVFEGGARNYDKFGGGYVYVSESLIKSSSVYREGIR